MKKTTFFVMLWLSLFTSLVYAQPANDFCSGAITLTVGATCSNTLITLDGTETDSGIGDPGCASYFGGDLWYKLVMPASGEIRVETDTDNGSITDGGMAIYTGADCNNLTLYQCDDSSNTSSGDDFERIVVTQPVGSTIYIRVWEYNGLGPGTFNICAYEFTPPPPPTNDDCVDAITLAVGAGCTPIIGTNSGATDSEVADATIPDPGCGSYLGGDVWFKLVVPPTGDLAIETYEDDLNITDGGMAIYSGTCDPNGLTLLSCDDDSGIISGEAFERIELLGQTPGETLFVRIWAYDNSEVGTFNICATEFSPLSVTNEEINTFSMYPNPAKGFVNFNSTINNTISIKVYDVQGKLILIEKSFKVNGSSQLDVSNLKSGVYFVKAEDGKNQIVKKLLIK
ncbi:MAG: T9SS type A sorting domain-containing protein [Flavobacteriaceae bacterium]